MIAAEPLSNVIAAVGAAVAAVLGGTAAMISALNRRTAKQTQREIATGNGRTTGDTIARIEADLAEHLRQTDELFGGIEDRRRMATWIRTQMEGEGR